MSTMVHSMFLLSLIIIIILPSYYAKANDYKDCDKSYTCSDQSVSNYPFWGGDRPEFCGHQGFELDCKDGACSFIDIEGLTFRALNINQEIYRMRLVRMDIYSSPCSPVKLGATSLNYQIFDFVGDTYQNLTLLYNCSGLQDLGQEFSFNCSGNGQGFYLNDSLLESYRGNSWFEGCYEKSITVPILNLSMDMLINNGSASLQSVLNGGFDIEYNSTGETCKSCKDNGRLCLYDNGFSCISISGGSMSLSKKLGIGIGVGVTGILLFCATYYCVIFRRKFKINDGPKEETIGDFNFETYLQKYGSLGPKRYKYSEIKRMTSSFKEKLGQGGYGTVYKGQLINDRFVAVKILNASKGNGKEFINEVASISKTSHVNVVTLLGFCLQGRKRALVYEFMPNGSLEKFVYSDKANPLLGWEKLNQIVIEIGRGLEYLHRGCSTRILHLDIKPHNILLDKNFSPKISDFGLAKLCPTEDSKMSILVAGGTIGYIAPEIFNRRFGRVSHKSDVYSYGMLLLEMVGGRKKPDLEINPSTDACFLQGIYKHLEMDTEFQFHDGMTDEELEIAKRIITVALWCIQIMPSDRPGMSKVIEMLEGEMDSLETPPKPLLHSPPRPPAPPMSSTSICSELLSSGSLGR